MCNIWLVWVWVKIVGAPTWHGWFNTKNNHTSHTSVLHTARTFKRVCSKLFKSNSMSTWYVNINPHLQYTVYSIQYTSLYGMLMYVTYCLQPQQGVSAPASGTWHGPSQHSLPSRRKPWERPRRWPKRWPFSGDSTRGSSRSQHWWWSSHTCTSPKTKSEICWKDHEGSAFIYEIGKRWLKSPSRQGRISVHECISSD